MSRHQPGQYIVSIRFDALTFVRRLNLDVAGSSFSSCFFLLFFFRFFFR